MKKELSASIRTGIWIDQDMAYLIRIKGNKEPEIKVLKSGVESRVRIKGEGKVYSRFGKTFIDDQEKKQKRQQQQRKFFYKEIIGQLKEMGVE